MSLSEYVRILGRGPGRSRALTQDEAQGAMIQMLSGHAAPEAMGALLMLLRMKGETAAEIAGFSAAAQAVLPEIGGVDLDWPSYAAGRTRGAPWFLLAARLVSRAGFRVLLHGWNGADPKVRAGLQTAGIPVAQSMQDASALLAENKIAYLPLETAHPALFDLLNLRDVLGLRSCVNTVCRMLNPGRAAASVQGVFHPSYRLLQADAAALLGRQNQSVIKGGGGEFELNPSKPITAFGLRGGTLWEQVLPLRVAQPRKLSQPDGPDLPDLLGGQIAPFEEQVVIGTAALALETLGLRSADQLARDLWRNERAHLLA